MKNEKRTDWYDLLKRTAAKNENIGQTYLKKTFELNNFSEILLHGYI